MLPNMTIQEFKSNQPNTQQKIQNALRMGYTPARIIDLLTRSDKR